MKGVPTQKRPARKRARLTAAFLAIVASFGGDGKAAQSSAAWKAARASESGKRGKHNGRTRGAFGRAKK